MTRAASRVRTLVREDVGMSSRISRRLLVLLTVTLMAALAATACGSGDDPLASPDTTTGTVPRNSTTTTTAVPEGTEDVPGLWLVTSTGLVDETGERWAAVKVDESLRNPVDDTAGGVYYLRCVGEAANCAVEHVDRPDGTPVVIGEAQRLLGLGVLGGRAVLITSWLDEAVTPSPETDTSGLVARFVDVQSRETTTPAAPWYGWESGPFAADVENDLVAACFGEGESCELRTATGLDGEMTTVAGGDFSTVMSVALDADATRLTWLVSEPMAGTVTARVLELPSGTPVDTQLRAAEEDPPDEVVTDGTWAAVRVGAVVTLTDLVQATTGEREVPPDVTEMALRSAGGASSGGTSIL